MGASPAVFPVQKKLETIYITNIKECRAPILLTEFAHVPCWMCVLYSITSPCALSTQESVAIINLILTIIRSYFAYFEPVLQRKTNNEEATNELSKSNIQECSVLSILSNKQLTLKCSIISFRSSLRCATFLPVPVQADINS